MNATQQPQGRACIYVPREIAPPGINIPISAYLTHGKIFEQWRSFVQLPHACALICAYVDQTYKQWVLIVGSDRLPVPTPNQQVPLLRAAFQHMPNGQVRLVRVAQEAANA